MKSILNKNLFILCVLIYFIISYFIFPYISSIINPKNIFYINNDYYILILFLIFSLTLIYCCLKIFYRFSNFNINNYLYLNDYHILQLAYVLFIFGFASKFLNIINGEVFNFEYSNINSKLFFIEYLSSMNILN